MEIKLTDEQIKDISPLLDEIIGYRLAINQLSKQLGSSNREMWKKLAEWYPEVKDMAATLNHTTFIISDE